MDAVYYPFIATLARKVLNINFLLEVEKYKNNRNCKYSHKNTLMELLQCSVPFSLTKSKRLNFLLKLFPSISFQNVFGFPQALAAIPTLLLNSVYFWGHCVLSVVNAEFIVTKALFSGLQVMSVHSI